MKATMQEAQLTLTSVVRRGARYFPDSQVVTLEADRTRRTPFSAVAVRAAKLAAALRRLGVADGDRVGTLCWNHQEHLEAYLAVPCMGAVLHTLNLRLAPDQLALVVNHGGDRVVIVDASLAKLYAAVQSRLTTVEHCIVIGDAAASGIVGALSYEDLLAAEDEGWQWPDLEEGSAAAMCHTTGTTGDPKGVVYSHRSQYLHTINVWANFQLTEHDRMLFIVPMFHANAWGLPYTGWMLGADLLFPGPHLQPEPLAGFITAERATFGGGVPTVLTGLLHHADSHAEVDLSSLRLMVCGGAAVPRSLIEAFAQRHKLRLLQAWGMTETSPVGAIAEPPKGVAEERLMDYRAKTGRPAVGVELRIVDGEGAEVPWDGRSVGEIEVRGPWIAASYQDAEAPEKFHDGWLRTGDVGNVDERGFVQITDRAKDVIKSGGEWISSVELENLLMGHPEVLDAAVIGVPDERWDERPLGLVVVRAGSEVSAEALRDHLAPHVAHFWLPEQWVFTDELPKTSVGKQDKKLMRQRHADGAYSVTALGKPESAR